MRVSVKTGVEEIKLSSVKFDIQSRMLTLLYRFTSFTVNKDLTMSHDIILSMCPSKYLPFSVMG